MTEEKNNKIMRYAIPGAVALFMIGSSLWYMTRTPFSDLRPRIGEMAPSVHLADLTGHMVTLGDFQGKVILVNFWATWCPPCRDETAWFERAYAEYQDKGFAVIGVAIDKLTLEDVKQLGVSYPLALANERILAEYGGSSGVPVSFLIGRDGKVLKKVSKVYPESDLRADITAALKAGR